MLVLCAGTKSLTLRPPVSNACAPSTIVCREWLWNLAFLLMDVLPIRLLASLLASLLPQRLLHLAGGDPTVSGPALTPVPTVCAARFIWIVNINPRSRRSGNLQYDLGDGWLPCGLQGGCSAF